MPGKLPKPKAVNFVLIPFDARATSPYRVLEEAREKWHKEIKDAKIALAWRKRLKQDRDGHLMLGKCVKVGDLQKEFAAYDFIILLNQEVWHDSEFSREKKLALLDHELCHADVSLSKEFETRRDERDRIIFRVRRHDIEEFRSVVEHHGCYKRDLEEFAKVLLKKAKPELPLGPLADETTVQIGIVGEDGKTEYGPKMTTTEFKEACDRVSEVQ